jgi:hypothetical protein
MELHQLIQNPDSCIKYLLNNSSEYRPTSNELWNHPFFLYEINRQMNKGADTALFCHNPVKDFYAYMPDQKNYALYFVIDFTPKLIPDIIAVMGYPENITKMDADSLDFDFMAWSTNDFYFYMSKQAEKKCDRSLLFVITNLKHKEIERKKPIQW